MANSTNILNIGPSPTQVGGMSAVLGQMLRLDFAGRYSMSVLPITISRHPGESRPQRVLRHVKQRLLLGRTLRQGDFGIIHIHTCSGFSFHRNAWDVRVARRKGLRTVLHMHGARFDEYYENAGSVEQAFIRRTLRMADRVIALSAGWRSRLSAIEPAASIHIIENAVETAKKTPHRPPNGACRFLMLARMDTWKGVDDLLEACACLRNCGVPFEVTLAGPEGTAGDRPAIEAKIGARRLVHHVKYLGAVHGDAKEKLLAESDVLVQPSHQEGLPISLLEAFAHGMPVVATRVGAVPEILEHDVEGLIVSPANPAELARAMGVLAIDPPRRRMLGDAGWKSATSRFALARFRDDLVALYDGLVREKRVPAISYRAAASALRS